MKTFKKIMLVLLVIILVPILCLLLWLDHMKSEKEKYLGHGFPYMHGYSSTDLSGYQVYDDGKLYHLDHEASLQISDAERMPVLDGAEACYPLYAALAKAVYTDIGAIEMAAKEEAQQYLDDKSNDFSKEMYETLYNNGKIVTFTNTVVGYQRLISHEADLFFGARPSAKQRCEASAAREQILSYPIGLEAFVFFVEADNPVTDLSSEQLRTIYHGDITSWKQVGGKDQKIVAFQRPEDSGSQAMMRYFMGDVSLKEPKTVEYIGGMGDIIREVADYHNEAGAIGYTFRYFLEELGQEKGVRILSVDGIAPTVENIADHSYPIVVPLVCARLASNDKEEVRQLLDYLQSPEGQEIIAGTGYVPIKEGNIEPFIENEIESRTGDEYFFENWTLVFYGEGMIKEGTDFELYNVDRYFKGTVGYDKVQDRLYLLAHDESFTYYFANDEKQVVLDQKEETADGLFLPEEGSVFIH